MTADHTTINEFTVAVKHVSGNEVAHSAPYQVLISAAELSFGSLMGTVPFMVAGADLR